jgi:hypothetical protein
VDVLLLLQADPGSLNETAKSFSRRLETDSHWSALALILGRIEREQLFHGYGYGSARAYAEHELRVTGQEFGTLRGLWEMMFACTPGISLDEWETVPKTYAIQIKRGLAAKNPKPPKELLAMARAAESADKFKETIDRLREEDPYTTIKFRCPYLVADLWDAAMYEALKLVTSEASPDPDLIHDPKYRHRCVEVILATFFASAPVDPKLT